MGATVLPPPFISFNFEIRLRVQGEQQFICAGAFSECDGLEMSMEVKTIREGGNNGRQFHLSGPVTYGQLTLKRGMTATLDLWNWFERVLQRREMNLRASGDIVLLAGDRTTPQAIFSVTGCLPMKLKAPSMQGKDGQIAIEEMQIAYETLSVSVPGGQGA